MDYVVWCTLMCQANGESEMVIPLLVRGRHFLRHRAVMCLGFVAKENRFSRNFPILKIYDFLETDGNNVRRLRAGENLLQKVNVTRIAGQGIWLVCVDIPRNDECAELAVGAVLVFADH